MSDEINAALRAAAGRQATEQQAMEQQVEQQGGQATEQVAEQAEPPGHWLRAALGLVEVEPGDDVSFDGGARSNVPPPAKTIDAVLRQATGWVDEHGRPEMSALRLSQRRDTPSDPPHPGLGGGPKTQQVRGPPGRWIATRDR